MFFVGKTNSGKSYVARYLLKMMRQAGWRIVIIDPKKDWMGRGDEKREFSSGDKKERGTVDRPVSVSSFRPVPLRSDISARLMGRENGGYVLGYNGYRQHDSLHGRSDPVSFRLPRPAEGYESNDNAGAECERWSMGRDAAPDECSSVDKRSGGGLAYFQTHQEGRS